MKKKLLSKIDRSIGIKTDVLVHKNVYVQMTTHRTAKGKKLS